VSPFYNLPKELSVLSAVDNLDAKPSIEEELFEIRDQLEEILP
jgi:hypothetical protein